ncbi:MAG: FHA domain-containing protein [Sedimentisphaerales bacterium]|nr:FHA domain-containing protein [Sedimentisphaerales bacterium]
MDISLILLKEDGTNKVFPVRSKATVLGRREDCDLCIPLHVISRRHCQLSQELDSLKIRDLKSSNGTYINGTKIEDETEAKAGDHVQIGPLTFMVQIDGKPAEISAADTAMLKPSPDISKANQDELNGSGTFVG